jgi:hypothetical protein
MAQMYHTALAKPANANWTLPQAGTTAQGGLRGEAGTCSNHNESLLDSVEVKCNNLAIDDNRLPRFRIALIDQP